MPQPPLEHNFFMLSKRFDTINGIILIYVFLYALGIFILPYGIKNIIWECMKVTFPYIAAFLFFHFFHISRKIRKQYLKEILIPFLLYALVFFILYKLIYNK